MYSEIASTIKTAISDYTAANCREELWGEPVMALLSAYDKRLKTLRQTVSPDHAMPDDILPGAGSIVVFFIPLSGNIISSNISGIMASPEWALAYVKTNDLIGKINDAIEALMTENGYKSGKIPATHNFNKDTLISNWSHRHIAAIAGLGTFGLNNMLITKKGCCGRLGSMVTDYQLPEGQMFKLKGGVPVCSPEFSFSDDIFAAGERCLNKLNGSCGVCRKKCVADAYSETGFDRHKCYKQCLRNADYLKESGLASPADVCGKCLVGLPCSVKAPLYVSVDHSGGLA